MIAQRTAVTPLIFGTLVGAAYAFFKSSYPNLKTFSDDWKRLTEKDKAEFMECFLKMGYQIGQAPGSESKPIIALPPPPPTLAVSVELPPVEVDDASLHAQEDGYKVGNEHPNTKAA